ncbi:MAG TPA: DUF4430 domain-containing protein [Negativicutes bacterium]|nr:DUF4430 domain-containing protein [Negativicutes bacterium]
MWWKDHKWKVIVPVLIGAVLAAAFWYGGGAPGLQGWKVDGDSPAVTGSPAPIASGAPDTTGNPKQSPPPETPEPSVPVGEKTESTPEPESAAAGLESRPGGREGGLTPEEKIAAAKEMAGGSSLGVMSGDKDYSESQGMILDPETGKDQYRTDPVPEGKPLPVEPEDVAISDTAYTCTLSISCSTILDHMDWLDPEKVELVPEDGWILKPVTVTFYEGESVFNVLQRTCKQQGIHMEFQNTPMYNSAYIEGINNLYEFDCGELSGWMYKVNEWFPNYGCSRYSLKDGDVVCWVYTCDLGADVGGFYAVGS